jgi:hypothetical protein
MSRNDTRTPNTTQANCQASSGLTVFFSASGREKALTKGELILAILQNVAAFDLDQ